MNNLLKDEKTIKIERLEKALGDIVEERDALLERLQKAKTEKAEAVKALLKAREFIKNGREFGYIKMPDMENDTALKVPGIIDNALEKLTGKRWDEVSGEYI